MANKLSGLPQVVISAPKVVVTKPAGVLPAATPLPDAAQSGAVSTPAIVPTAAQVSELVQAATQDPTE